MNSPRIQYTSSDLYRVFGPDCDQGLVMRWWDLTFHLALYLDVEPIQLGEPDVGLRDVNEHIAQLRERMEMPSELIERLNKSARYIAKIEDDFDQAKREERQAKSAFLAAIINAVEPALPALAEPLISKRTFAPDQDEHREMFKDQRGIYLLDGWRREVQGGRAGRSLVLDEGGNLSVHTFTAMHTTRIGHPSTNGFYEVFTASEPIGIAEAIQVFPRRSFMAAVDHLVTKVWRLTRRSRRKDQIKESQALADKLAAVRTLLQGDA